MKAIFSSILILSFVVLSFAQTAKLNLIRMRYGQQVSFASAQALGLAGCGLAQQGNLAKALENPALVFEQRQGQLTLQAGLMTDKLIEDRQFPYYDSFVGFNDFGSYSYNSNYYFSPYVQARYRLPFERPMSIQAGFVPFLDFRYNYAEEVRDPFDKSDKLLGYNRLEQNGLLNQTFVAFSAQVIKNLNVGLKIGILSGSIDSTMQIQPRVPGNLFPEQREERQRDLTSTPFLVNFGLHYTVNERLAVGAFVRLPYTLKFENKLQTDAQPVKEKLSYPLTLGGGLDYRFQSILSARVFLDYLYTFSSKFEDSQQPNLHFRDTFTLRGGAEYFIFHNQMPLRLGFSYFTLPYNYNLANTVISAGTGWYFGRWQLDLAAGLNHQEFYQPDLFPDTIYGLNARTDLDRVKWTNYYFRFDVTINLF